MLRDDVRYAIEVYRLLAQNLDRLARTLTAGALLTVVVASALHGLTPLALQHVVDTAASAIPSQAGSRIATDVLLSATWYLGALCTARALAELRPYLSGRADQRMRAHLTTDTFRHIMNLPMSWHVRQRAGGVVQMLSQAGIGCQLLLGCVLGGVAPVLVELSTVLLVLSSLQQSVLIMIFLLAALGYIAVLQWGAPGLARMATQVSRQHVDVHAVMVDSLPNCEAIKTYGAQRAISARHASATTHLVASWSRLQERKLRMALGTTLVFGIAMGAALLESLDAVAQGAMTIGGLVMAIVCLLQIVRPLEALAASSREAIHALAWIRPLLDVRRLQPERGVAPAEVTSCSAAWNVERSPISPALEFRNVTFGYEPGAKVLDGLDLEIAPGRTVAVVGASGSGKSTLMRLVLQLYEPQGGRIIIGGRDAGDMALSRLREMVVLIPQDTVLFHDTIATNVALHDPMTPRHEIVEACRLAQLHDVVMSFPEGYDTLVGDRGLRLSGGERQRIAIARALLRNPAVLLLDEATSMLDAVTEAAILRNLRTISAGRTTLMIAHKLSTVVHADVIAVMSSGRVIESGTHVQLLQRRNGAYARLWRAQHASSGS